MEEKISLPYKQKVRTKSIKWAVSREQVSKASLLGIISFFVVLSLKNGFLFLDKILLASGIIVGLLIASSLKHRN